MTMLLEEILNNEANYQYLMTDIAVAIADQVNKDGIKDVNLSTEYGKACKIIATFANLPKTLEFGFKRLEDGAEASLVITDDYTGETIRYSAPWPWFNEVSVESVLNWISFD